MTVHRHREIQRIRSTLERNGFPRLQMLLLVALTGASGFLASYLLLHAGLTEMWLRYLAAFGVAYLAFLFLLWLWLRTKAEDYSDLPNINTSPSGSHPGFEGQGGEFGGGGASASFEAPADGALPVDDSAASVGDALGSAADAGEFAIPLVLLVIVGAMALSSLFVIYSAPTLFAELVVDGLLSASLYRRLRGLETNHWLETALRRTALPFLLSAAIASASGWALGLYVPEAHSLGQVIAHARGAA